MYFEIENTPKHVKKARQLKTWKSTFSKEECPLLILAPFTRPPQVLFENVLIGTTCERNLQVFNPSKQPQQITLERFLPLGLVIHLPRERLELEPETCYCLTMAWTPTDPIAVKETVRFTDENRGRYDIAIILKSVTNIEGKPPKGFEISPGKTNKKPHKKSPVTTYKQKCKIMYNTTQNKKTGNIYETTEYVHTFPQKVLKPTYNMCDMNDEFIESYPNKCLFENSKFNTSDFKPDMSEVFSNMKNPQEFAQPSNGKYIMKPNILNIPEPQNILTPSNTQSKISGIDLFENLTFTPLKTIVPSKNDKLDNGPKLIVSMDSKNEFMKFDLKHEDKENEIRSLYRITSSQPPNKQVSVNHQNLTQIDCQNLVTPDIKKEEHPNTSSPKDMKSPYFSINTDFLQNSDLSFSTERKALPKINKNTQDIIEEMNVKPNSDTYTKYYPITPMELHSNQMHMEAKPPIFHSKDKNPKMCKQSLFREHQQQKEAYDRNYLHPRSYIQEHNVWDNDVRASNKYPPRCITPLLESIPEESTQLNDIIILNRSDKQSTFTKLDDLKEKRDPVIKLKEEQRLNRAATQIQALYRGHVCRTRILPDKRVADLRRRWREGALVSKESTLKERNKHALEVVSKMSDIGAVIKAFQSLDLLTAVLPMSYAHDASLIVDKVYTYMMMTNRSLTSIDLLKSAANLLINLTRYNVTGPKIYQRKRIPLILKFMWRFVGIDSQLFCRLATYLWLFSKYDEIKKDLTEFLHDSEHHKMLVAIKTNVLRIKKITNIMLRSKFHMPQNNSYHCSMNSRAFSSGSNISIILPALELDYGITRVNKPRYFEDAQQAINCLFNTFRL